MKRHQSRAALSFRPTIRAVLPAAILLLAAGCPQAVPPTGTTPPDTNAPPAITVPTNVKAIVQDNCARCHVAKPANHTGDRDVQQCGICHRPYGNTDAFAHNESTSGCTACHTTPEGTHFFLRDDEDQLALKADATEDCIACHRDGSTNTTGRGRPALDTDDAIIAAARNGSLRSWIQPGGFMAKYVAADQIATITNWIDTTFADRDLGYDPYLDAVKIDADFDINGRGDNPAWDQATEHVVSVEPTIYTAASEIKMKALYSDTNLYMRVEYADATLSMTRSNSWILDNGTWRHPIATTENDKQSEDRVAVLWNMSIPTFRERFGCAIKCHGNVPGSAAFTDSVNAVGDMWHTKAARDLGLSGGLINSPVTVQTAGEAFEVTGGSVTIQGVLDDKRIVWYRDFDDGFDTEDSGRRGDAGKKVYANNRNDDKSGPLWMETEPTDWIDAMVLTQDEIDSGEAIGADPTATDYDATAAAAAWDQYVTLSAVVPERVLSAPEGSRGDVLDFATWTDGVWVHEFQRKLVTGNTDDDVQFDVNAATEYDYSIAVFDNAGRGEIPPGHTTYGDGQYQILRFLP